MQYFTVSIPVKTYVRKYIEARYPQPFTVTLNNYLGNVVYSYIEKQNKIHLIRNGRFTRITHIKLNDTFKVLIPRYLVNNYFIGLQISEVKAILINNLFEEKIIEDLYIFCRSYELTGKPRRQAIEDFCDQHNIELDIDISYAAFKKAEYRHRKTLNKNPSFLSPPVFATG